MDEPIHNKCPRKSGILRARPQLLRPIWCSTSSNYTIKSNNAQFAIRIRISLAGYFCLGRNSPKLPFFSAVVFLPLHIGTNHNDVGVTLIGQSPPLIKTLVQWFVCGDRGSKRLEPPISSGWGQHRQRALHPASHLCEYIKKGNNE
jgi:hypothetical protein